MRKRGTLLNCEEALRSIEEIEEPVTRNLVNMAFVHMVKTSQLQGQVLPGEDVDMLFVVAALKDFFSEHDVIARALAGEKVGAWFED